MNNENIKNMVNNYSRYPKISKQTIIREILQQVALLGLERSGFFEKAAFYGGTALRILYGLDRFSEDLDFTLLNPDPLFDFNFFLTSLKRELLALGYKLEIEQKQKTMETNILSAFMKVNSKEYYLSIGDPIDKIQKMNHNELIKVKIEIDINPPPHARFENHLILNPVPFYVLTLNKSDLFAGKMHATLYRAWKGRVKGRDWYDLIWYIKNYVPLNKTYLESCMKQAGNLPESEKLTLGKIKELLSNKILQINWEDAKEDVRSFIVNPEQLDIWSSQFFLKLIENIIVTEEDSSRS